MEITAITDETPQTIYLNWGPVGAPITESDRAGIFGQLFLRAAPVVKHYTGDLYHDATWIREQLTGPGTFFYRVRPMGTHIGTDVALVACTREPGDELYRVDVKRDERGRWSVTFIRIDVS